LLLQSQFGCAAAWAGLAAAPAGLLPVMLTPAAGRALSRTDVRLIVTVSFSVFALIMFCRANFSPAADLAFVVWPQAAMGLAVACFFVPIDSLAFIGMAPEKTAGASGLFNCVRAVFTAIGASAATALWERREALRRVRLSGLIDPCNPAVDETLAAPSALGLDPQAAAACVQRQIFNQSFIMAGA
jgi:DHA2 family multidrug resistance protein